METVLYFVLPWLLCTVALSEFESAYLTPYPANNYAARKGCLRALRNSELGIIHPQIGPATSVTGQVLTSAAESRDLLS